MAWYNPATWSTVDAIQNKLGSFKSQANSVSGASPTRKSGTAGISYNIQPAPATSSSQASNYSAIDPNQLTGANSYGYAVGGGGASNPLAGLRQQATDRIHSILSAYDSLFGGIDTSARDQADRLNSAYDTQTQNLNKAYETGQGQTGAAYAAKGLGQSSFLGDALGQNTDIYNQNNQSLVDSRNNSLADLGRYVSTSKAQLGAGKDTYNNMLGQLANYGEGDLNSLIPSLQSAYGNLQTQQAGLGTDSQFIQGLNAITPVQNHGVDQLSAKLQQVVQSGTPQFAKNALLNGLIKQAQITDPQQASYWQNYYNQLIGA